MIKNGVLINAFVLYNTSTGGYVCNSKLNIIKWFNLNDLVTFVRERSLKTSSYQAIPAKYDIYNSILYVSH